MPTYGGRHEAVTLNAQVRSDYYKIILGNTTKQNMTEQKHLNNRATNYFCGSVYADRLKTKAELEGWFAKSKLVDELWFQLERGENGNLHWQYTFRTTGKQQRYSYWWKLLNYKSGEWIDGCLKKQACLNYCKKGATRVEGPYHWDRPADETYIYNTMASDSENLKGLLANKVREMQAWAQWRKENSVVNGY